MLPVKGQTGQVLIRLLPLERSDQGLLCLLRYLSPNIQDKNRNEDISRR